MDYLNTLIDNALIYEKSKKQEDKGVTNMVDVSEYKDLYKKAKEIRISEALQLIREAESDEEKSFYAHILNLHFQQKQKAAIERNLF